MNNMKKIVICILVAVFIITIAVTAFASISFSNNNLMTYYTTSPLYISVNMYGKYVNTKSCFLDGVGCLHRCWLGTSSTAYSSRLTVSQGQTKYLYPNETGTYRLCIENYYYYNQQAIKVAGTFSNLYK
mgnify:CR=1 FL=1